MCTNFGTYLKSIINPFAKVSSLPVDANATLSSDEGAQRLNFAVRCNESTGRNRRLFSSNNVCFLVARFPVTTKALQKLFHNCNFVRKYFETGVDVQTYVANFTSTVILSSSVVFGTDDAFSRRAFSITATKYESKGNAWPEKSAREDFSSKDLVTIATKLSLRYFCKICLVNVG